MMHDDQYRKEMSGRGINLCQTISTTHHSTDWIWTSSNLNFFSLNLRENMFLRYQTTSYLFYKRKRDQVYGRKGNDMSHLNLQVLHICCSGSSFITGPIPHVHLYSDICQSFISKLQACKLTDGNPEDPKMPREVPHVSKLNIGDLYHSHIYI